MHYSIDLKLRYTVNIIEHILDELGRDMKHRTQPGDMHADLRRHPTYALLNNIPQAHSSIQKLVRSMRKRFLDGCDNNNIISADIDACDLHKVVVIILVFIYIAGIYSPFT